MRRMRRPHRMRGMRGMKGRANRLRRRRIESLPIVARCHRGRTTYHLSGRLNSSGSTMFSGRSSAGSAVPTRSEVPRWWIGGWSLPESGRIGRGRWPFEMVCSASRSAPAETPPCCASTRRLFGRGSSENSAAIWCGRSGYASPGRTVDNASDFKGFGPLPGYTYTSVNNRRHRLARRSEGVL